MDELPDNDGHNEDRDANVGSDKGRRIPPTLEENGVAGDQSDDAGANEAHPGGIWL